MRKLLLATVAALGASTWVASYADAQIVDDTDGQTFPTPGQVTVRLNGRFRFYAGIIDNGAARTSNFGVASPSVSALGSGAASGTTAVGATTQGQGTNRLSNYGFTEYARLYPGFDGVAANGLKYGASLEIRQDNNFGAGAGAEGSVTGLDRSRGQLYFRRTCGYIGTDRFGTVRVGSTDQPTSLYLTGNFENFDDGGLNGDLPGFLPSGGFLNWPFNDVGNIYSTTKAVYLSPQFYGVDFGVSYEPSTAGIGGDNGSGCNPAQNIGGGNALTPGPQSVATPGCDALASTSTGDIARRKNTYEGLVRYRGTFGPVGIAATAAYIGSGRVLDSGVQGSTTNPKRVRLEDLSYGDFGLVATYGGLSVGGNYEVGRYNVLGGGGAGGLLTRGQPNSNALVVGASYTIGPVIFGAHYLESWYQGNQTAATNAGPNTNSAAVLVPGGVRGGQRRDVGVAAGATYSLAPGVSLFASYICEEARQRGVNLLTGGSNVGLARDVHNKLTARCSRSAPRSPGNTPHIDRDGAGGRAICRPFSFAALGALGADLVLSRECDATAVAGRTS